MSKTTLQILKDARELLSDKSRWTQGKHARDSKQQCVPVFSEDAVCFCSAGALHRVAGAEGSAAADDAWSLLDRLAGPPLTCFNDHRTHEEVLELFDKAISQEEGN